MTSRSLLLASTAVLLASALPAIAVAGTAHASGLAVPVKCETSAETVLAWDGVTYDLQGTCGVVRVLADHATVTMPSATKLIVDGTGNTITAKPIFELDVSGADNMVTTPSLTSLTLSGASSVQVAGLVEKATVSAGGSSLTAHTAYRTRITGSANTVALTRAERVVLTGDHNAVAVTRGRTTVRDRGIDNTLDLRARRR